MHFFGGVTSGGEQTETEAASRSSDILCFSEINVTLLVWGTLEFAAEFLPVPVSAGRESGAGDNVNI